MKYLKPILCSLALAFAISCFPSCSSTKLATGGAYAPTNSVGQVTAAPDPAFYATDAAFSLAYGTVQAVFKFELDNREYLWGLSPDIKKTLDGIRPDVVLAVQNYFVARTAYKDAPTPAGLSTLDAILARAQQLAATAQAVTSNLQPKGN